MFTGLAIGLEADLLEDSGSPYYRGFWAGAFLGCRDRHIIYLMSTSFFHEAYGIDIYFYQCLLHTRRYFVYYRFDRIDKMQRQSLGGHL